MSVFLFHSERSPCFSNFFESYLKAMFDEKGSLLVHTNVGIDDESRYRIIKTNKSLYENR
jgi:hypothetical protein